MNPEVETATEADFPAIAALNVLAYRAFEARMTPEDWAAMQASISDVAGVAERARFLVIRANGEIAASVAYVRPGDSVVPFPVAWASILLLAVSPRYRKRGLARALVGACLARARGDGARTVGLYTSELMEGARRLYESSGFVEDGELARRHGLRYRRYKLVLRPPHERDSPSLDKWDGPSFRPTRATSVHARRRPWLAVLLTLFAPGLGHLYAGRPGRALLASLLYVAVFPAVALLGLSLRGSAAALWLPLFLGALLAVILCADAARQAGAGRALLDRRWKRAILYAVWFAVLLVGADLARAAVRENLARTFRLSTGSMVPTLLPGDHFLVDRRAYREAGPARGDLVVFRSPGDPPGIYVKRAIGLPGDEVRFKYREVYVNGNADGYTPSDIRFETMTMEPDAYFLLGDDRARSLDSRSYGPVSTDRILGRLSHIYFSRDPDTGRVRWERTGLVPE